MSSKIVALLTALLVTTLLAAPVFAQADPGKLWFYSSDPTSASGYPPLPNPEDWDPLYNDAVGVDDWTDEGVVLSQGDWEDPFSLWIGLHQGDMSYDTTLVISVNDVAYAAIAGMTVEGNPVGAWNTQAPIPPDVKGYPLGPHGVFNSAEWAGYVEVIVGDIPSEGALEINIDLDINTDLTGAKIHFDAYGWSEDPGDEGTGDWSDADITNPFSHDITFIVPEVATIFLTASSMIALGAYAYRRKKQ